jgi:hypothetical protein
MRSEARQEGANESTIVLLVGTCPHVTLARQRSLSLRERKRGLPIELTTERCRKPRCRPESRSRTKAAS